MTSEISALGPHRLSWPSCNGGVGVRKRRDQFSAAAQARCTCNPEHDHTRTAETCRSNLWGYPQAPPWCLFGAALEIPFQVCNLVGFSWPCPCLQVGFQIYIYIFRDWIVSWQKKKTNTKKKKNHPILPSLPRKILFLFWTLSWKSFFLFPFLFVPPSRGHPWLILKIVTPSGCPNTPHSV